MFKKLLVTAAAAAAVSVPLAGVASAAPPSDSGSNDNVIVAGGEDDVPPSEGLSTLPPGIRIVGRHLASLGGDGDMSEIQQMRMQMYMERRAKSLREPMSNMLKKASDTAVTVTQNIK